MTLFNKRVSSNPRRLKNEMIQNLVQSAGLTIVAAYGSSKDVPIYQSISVPPERTFVIGKFKSRLRDQVRFISDGYALHLGKICFQ